MPKQFGQSPIAARQQIGQGEAQVFRPSVMDTSAIQNRVAQQEALAAKQAKAAADEAAKRDNAANIELKDDLGIYTEVAQREIDEFRQWADEHKTDPDYWNQLNRKKNEIIPRISAYKYGANLAKEAMKNPDKYDGVEGMAAIYDMENAPAFMDPDEAYADLNERVGGLQAREFIDIPEQLLGSMGKIKGTGDKVTVVDPVTGEEKTTDQNYITAGDKNRFRVNNFAEAERQLAQNPRGTDSWQGALLKQAREKAAQFSDDPDEQKELTRKWFNNQIDDYWDYLEHVKRAKKPEGKKGGLNFNFLGGGRATSGGYAFDYSETVKDVNEPGAPTDPNLLPKRKSIAISWADPDKTGDVRLFTVPLDTSQQEQYGLDKLVDNRVLPIRFEYNDAKSRWDLVANAKVAETFEEKQKREALGEGETVGEKEATDQQVRADLNTQIRIPVDKYMKEEMLRTMKLPFDELIQSIESDQADSSAQGQTAGAREKAAETVGGLFK